MQSMMCGTEYAHIYKCCLRHSYTKLNETGNIKKDVLGDFYLHANKFINTNFILKLKIHLLTF